jgi:GNAT superfamily N-acetyltransferase
MIEVRSLEIEEASAAAALIADAFAPRLHAYMTYTQRGAASFLTLPLRFANLFPTRELRVAGPCGAPLAFAEWQTAIQGELFLSYICVSPEARGRGVAHAMIRDEVHRRGATTLKLDVFSDNGPAIRLYEGLGLTGRTETGWWRRDLPPAKGSIRVENAMSALAAYDVYGFCEMVVEDESGPFSFGRLGPSVVRCRDHALFSDSHRLAGIRAMFPELKEALYIGREASGGQLINRSIRLEGTVRGF